MKNNLIFLHTGKFKVKLALISISCIIVAVNCMGHGQWHDERKILKRILLNDNFNIYAPREQWEKTSIVLTIPPINVKKTFPFPFDGDRYEVNVNSVWYLALDKLDIQNDGKSLTFEMRRNAVNSAGAIIPVSDIPINIGMIAIVKRNIYTASIAHAILFDKKKIYNFDINNLRREFENIFVP